MKRSFLMFPLVLLAACGAPSTSQPVPAAPAAPAAEVPQQRRVLAQSETLTLFSGIPQGQYSDYRLFVRGADGRVRASALADGQSARVIGAALVPGTDRAYLMLWKTVNGFAQDSIVEVDLSTDQVLRVVKDLTASDIDDPFGATLTLQGDQLIFRAFPVFDDPFSEPQTVAVDLNGDVELLRGSAEAQYMRHLEQQTASLSAAGLIAQADSLQLYWPKTVAGFNVPGSELHTSNDFYALDINLGGGDDDYGEGVRAAAGGTVRVTPDDGRIGYGLYITIVHPNGAKTRYAHLATATAADGAYVNAKQTIGAVGNSGLPTPTPTNPTYAHLHFVVYNVAAKGVPIANASYPMYVKYNNTCQNRKTDMRFGGTVYSPC